MAQKVSSMVQSSLNSYRLLNFLVWNILFVWKLLLTGKSSIHSQATGIWLLAVTTFYFTSTDVGILGPTKPSGAVL